MEKWHMDRIAQLGCLICKWPAEIHHEHRGWEARDHKRTVPLCPDHHTDCATARHSVSHGRFQSIYGVDLRKRARKLWDESMEMFNAD